MLRCFGSFSIIFTSLMIFATCLDVSVALSIIFTATVKFEFESHALYTVEKAPSPRTLKSL